MRPNQEVQEFFIPSDEADQLLYLRNRFPRDQQRFTAERTVLFIHGATFPAESMFDIDLPGGSWLKRMADAGFDAYLLDIRGYGRSSRPATMDEDPLANPPFAHTENAVADLAHAVEFISQRRCIDRINLIGWSWGTAIAAGFAAIYPERVARLVLNAPLWKISGAPPVSGKGAYRLETEAAVRQRLIRGIPAELVEEISPTVWFRQWWQDVQASDPNGARLAVPGVRAPNGVTDDIARIWAQGKATYDPASITAPSLLAVGEWDLDTPPRMAEELFNAMTGTVYKRLAVLKRGTHWMLIEAGREMLIREVEDFLLPK